MNRGPYRRALDRGHRPGWYVGGLAEAGHIFDRDFDAELERSRELAAGELTFSVVDAAASPVGSR